VFIIIVPATTAAGMSGNRKLQAEIDRVLKKVNEGSTEFDQILKKVRRGSCAADLQQGLLRELHESERKI
jgi:hypothetical protein